MKLSIFASSIAHPKNKEEKQLAARKTSKPNLPECIEINSDAELIDAITKYAWSPFVFSGVRDEENFVSTDLLVFDFDSGATIDEVDEVITSHNLCALCLPTVSHSPEAHRFRLVLPLAHTIYDLEEYRLTWNKGAELFPTIDTSCRDGARVFFGSTQTDGFWIEGELFQPVKTVQQTSSFEESRKGVFRTVTVTEDIAATITSIFGKPREKVSEAVSKFIKEAPTGMPGAWISSLNAFCYSLSLSRVEESVIMSTVEQLAPEPLDSKDLYQITKAIKDGTRKREDEL